MVLLLFNGVVGDNPAAGGTGLAKVTCAGGPLAITAGGPAVAIELAALTVGTLVALDAGLVGAASGGAT